MTRRWRSFASRAAITTVILGVLFAWLHPGNVVSIMSRTGIVLWAGIVVVNVGIHGFQAAKWRLLLSAAGNRTGWLQIIRAHGSGLFANSLLPSIIGGDLVRVGLVSGKGRWSSSVTGSVADRVTDVGALIILAVGGLISLPSARTGASVEIVAVSLLLLIIGVGAVLAVVANAARFPEKIRGALEGLSVAVASMKQRKGATAIALSTAVFVQVVLVMGNVLVGEALGIDVPAAVWFVAFPLSKLVAFVPISLGGLGIREGVITAVLVPFAVPPVQAVAESLVWQTIVYAVGICGGLIAVVLGRFLTERHGSTFSETDAPGGVIGRVMRP